MIITDTHARIGIKHPPPVIIFPTLRCRPDVVSGMPVARDIFDFIRVTPVARLHEKPPKFRLRLAMTTFLQLILLLFRKGNIYHWIWIPARVTI